MLYENTNDAVRDIRSKIEARAVHVNWPSAQTLASSTQRKSKRKGPGFEFAGHKVFDPADGDDARHIDSNASASEPEDDVYIVKTTYRPRALNVNVLLDVNRSMNLGTSGTLKSILGAMCAGTAIISARKTKDQASFISYGFKPVSIVKPRNAQAVLFPALVKAVEDRDSELASRPTPNLINKANSLLERLTGGTIDTELSTDDGGGFALAFTAARRADSASGTTMRGVYVVVSDFVNMNEDDWDAMRLCGAWHDTIAVFVQDQRERELPSDIPWPGISFTLEDHTGQSVSLWVVPDGTSDWVKSLWNMAKVPVTTPAQYRENFERHEAEIKDRLHSCGVHVVTVSTETEGEAVRNLLSALANKLR